MNEKEIRLTIHNFVGNSLRITTFGDSQDIFTRLGGNSLVAVEVRNQVERTFGITISDAEAKNLRTVDAITQFVLKKLG